MAYEHHFGKAYVKPHHSLTPSAGAEERGKEVPFVVPVEIHPDSSKAQIRGKTLLFSSAAELRRALLLTIFHACQGQGIFHSPIL